MIPSSTRRKNLASSLTARSLVLSRDDIAAVEALGRSERIVSPDFGPAWD